MENEKENEDGRTGWMAFSLSWICADGGLLSQRSGINAAASQKLCSYRAAACKFTPTSVSPGTNHFSPTWMPSVGVTLVRFPGVGAYNLIPSWITACKYFNSPSAVRRLMFCMLMEDEEGKRARSSC